uniref:Uncharacterized protein n=1 Tax=Takifugu rubripes TaxID=31033 RepID=A0A674MJC9_TAKRU
MALYGVMGEFKVEKEPWKAYVERLEQFLEANNLAEGKKVATLLSVMGAVYLVQPDKPKDKTFDEIVTVLKGHFGPRPLLVLKQCAANCEFGTNLDASLRDRFVSGMRIEACTRRLLSENDLTFTKACEIALNMETADRDARQLRGMESETAGAASASVHKVKLQGARSCYRCKGKNPHLCPFHLPEGNGKHHERLPSCSFPGRPSDYGTLGGRSPLQPSKSPPTLEGIWTASQTLKV